MFNLTIVYIITENKRTVNKCNSVGIVMQPEIKVSRHSLIPLTYSSGNRSILEDISMFVSRVKGLALKLPAHSHSSHFIKLQASEPHKCWNCVSVFFLSFFPGDIVNMVYEVEVSPGHMRAGHESQALGLHFTNKLSLLQTGGKAAPHFFSFHFQ